MKALLVLTGALLAMFLAGSAASPEYSQLWGQRGEKWSATGRLPDFSYAGYHNGEDPLPASSTKIDANVRDFGAKGDGEHDDSDAFAKAIASIQKGTVFIPAGRYKITGILEIQRSGIIVRGAGPDKTTLYFPTPLNEIRPNWGATTSGQRTSNYSWSGGFLWVRGEAARRTLATVTAAAQRGDTAVTVSSAAALKVGQLVRIAMRDNPDNSLASYLYSGDPSDTTQLKGKTRAALVTRINSISGNVIHLQRPLRFDLREQWHPEILAFEPKVTEVGIEDVHFEFPAIDYAGHFTELGFNAVAFSDVSHCWVRNIRITNPDSGLFIGGTFNTVQGVVIESSRKPGKPDRYSSVGHHGIYIHGEDNVFTQFDYRMKFVHDISVSLSSGNVISNGKGIDLALDHHKAVPYENLFTNIDVGAGTRVWASGGGSALGRNCAARGTFWSIRSRAQFTYPRAGWGPASMNLVGLNTTEPAQVEPDGVWHESIRPDQLTPANIHEAQLAKRLGKK